MVVSSWALALVLGAGAAEREAALVSATGAKIEALRRSEAMIAVVGPDGAPRPGVAVEIRQVSSEFLFGANIYLFDRCKSPEQAQAYRDRFLAVFNYATTDFYWKYYEPERGRPRYAHTDAVAAWCAAEGIRLKGHPLLWQHTTGTVDWAKGADQAAIERARVEDLVTRYRGRIQSWDVVNEPAHAAREVEAPFRWARAADPGAELLINDYEVFANGFPKYLELVADLLKRGTPIDAIGIQGHFPLDTRFPLERVVEHLDRYAQLGKPLHITELVIGSGGQKILGSHVQGAWDEAAQADYVDKLYRVLFAHPAVAAIGWWDLSDLESWKPGTGLVRADMSPKPAYEALRRLIRDEWRTALDATTGADGLVRFRGFQGNYRVSAAGTSVDCRVKRGGLNACRLVLADETGAGPPRSH